jgi:hypothetical protein
LRIESVISVLADEDFNAHLLTGLLRRRPELRIERVVEVGLGSRPDSEVLGWAAERGYVFLTHDARTVPAHFFERLRIGSPVPGVVVVPQSMAIGAALDQLELVLFGLEAGELTGRVMRLPL